MGVTAGSSKLSALVRRLAAELEALDDTPRAPQPARTSRQLQHRLWPDQVAQLITDYQAGRATKDLARDYAISRDTVTQHLKRAGAPLRSRSLSDDQKAECERLYLSRWSLQRIADRYGKDDETIRQSLNRRRQVA